MEFPKEMITIAKDVDKSLMAYLDVGKNEKLRKAMKHYPEAGGKRMRPVMAILVAEAVGKKGGKAMPFGCSLEINHNFTLVHDDVIDQDPVRRGRPSVHVLLTSLRRSSPGMHCSPSPTRRCPRPMSTWRSPNHLPFCIRDSLPDSRRAANGRGLRRNGDREDR